MAGLEPAIGVPAHRCACEGRGWPKAMTTGALIPVLSQRKQDLLTIPLITLPIIVLNGGLLPEPWPAAGFAGTWR